MAKHLELNQEQKIFLINCYNKITKSKGKVTKELVNVFNKRYLINASYRQLIYILNKSKKEVYINSISKKLPFKNNEFY